MNWKRARRQDPEIAPDEIFLDASNAPAFDRARFEGRLEKPLSRGTFLYLAVLFGLLFIVLIVRSWNLQIANGPAFAAESAHNSLEARILFAPRGVITDINGVVVAENAEKEDGSVLRNYPFPSLSQIIGYVSYPKKDTSGIYYDTSETGISGLEAEYDLLLTGTNGQLLTETDAFGRVRSEGLVVPAESGGTLQLSIDANLQKLFSRAIANVASDHHFIAGAGVILDVDSGAVRAISSYPSYDPNVMSNGGPASTIDSYNANPGRPFLDHAVQGVYAPGSIVKPLVASGALTDGIITPDTIIDDPGFISIPDPYHPGKEFIYKGWRALGPVDVKKAIAWSSDIFFYTVGGGFKSQKGLGIDRLDYWYRQFGLGMPTGVNLSGEASGLIPTPAWKKETFNEPWYLGDTYFTAIGQYSVQVTPIQMVRAIAAVANGGKLFTPTLLANQTPRFTLVPADASALAVVREGMRQSVTNALASAINMPYVSVAAKTGTAQTGTRNQYDNSWVVGFFPYEHPQYAFAVVLERGPEGAGEQAVNVMQEFFDSLYVANSPYVGGGL
ncbi:MAG: penicillin-binding transpeptidase domain-containing protein [Candidatus Parcubacteria bacterium]|nr:penicillin-binding transpeptidase domain-containing protein [Candidatus Parcubacteria bacterium]